MKSRHTLILLLYIFSIVWQSCGFVRNARVTKEYLEAFSPESAEECLVTWPFHVILIPVTAIVDQTIHTVEIIPEAGTDAWDYLLLKGNGNNVMLEQAIFIPKTLVTPVVFILAYITRWFVPIEEDTRPFEMEGQTKERENQPETNQTAWRATSKTCDLPNNFGSVGKLTHSN